MVEKLILSKNANNKKCASKFVFFDEKKIEKNSDIFDFESLFFALCDKQAKLGKVSQDTYNPGKWLIL